MALLIGVTGAFAFRLMEPRTINVGVKKLSATGTPTGGCTQTTLVVPGCATTYTGPICTKLHNNEPVAIYKLGTNCSVPYRFP